MLLVCQLQPRIFQTRSKVLGDFIFVGSGLGKILPPTLVPQPCKGCGNIPGHGIPQRNRVGLWQAAFGEKCSPEEEVLAGVSKEGYQTGNEWTESPRTEGLSCDLVFI